MRTMRYKLDELTGEIIDTKGVGDSLVEYYDLNCIQDARELVNILNKYETDASKLCP